MRKRVRSRRWYALAVLSAVALGGETRDNGPKGDPDAAGDPTPVARATVMRYLTKRVEPEYPPMARRFGVEGAVALDAIIGQDGMVESISPAAGHPVLRHAALGALSQWRFRPILVGKKPARVVCRFEFEFHSR